LTARVVAADRIAVAASLLLAGVRILVVDNHADSREALQLVLEAFGATVATARTGHGALALTALNALDVILCDVRMSGMDGFEILARLRAKPSLQRIRVVALTGDEDRRRTVEAGFDGHEVKPFDEGRLVATVLRVLGRQANRP
jgi:two-component system, chemotaxis family, CheB/CheR fusion protein